MSYVQDVSPHRRIVSEVESREYYYGLRYGALLVARTDSNLWFSPANAGGAWPRRKKLSIAGAHKIQDIWEGDLAWKVIAILDANGTDWTSIDVLRIGYADEEPGGLVVWIGVEPGSLSFAAGSDVAFRCKRVLLDHDIHDIEVEIRESRIILLNGPPLLDPTFECNPLYDSNPIVEARRPFTCALGVNLGTPQTVGTGGFFVNEGGDGKRLFLVTARHAILPVSQSDTTLYDCNLTSQPRHNIFLLNETSFTQHLSFVDEKIKLQDGRISYLKRCIETWAGQRGRSQAIAKSQHDLRRTEAYKDALNTFLRELSDTWAPEPHRILGHLFFSPSLAFGAGPDHFTRDVAVIEIDRSKIDPSNFIGNVIDLGHKFHPSVLWKMMANSKSAQRFDFPYDRLLRLRGTISVDEMRHPTLHDEDGRPCIKVLKHGAATGLTVGRANNIFSLRRHGKDRVSVEWCILHFDHETPPFSMQGDSGSVVVDGTGRMGGIITAGAGGMDIPDVTYATPISYILETIRNHEALARACPAEAGPMPRYY